MLKSSHMCCSVRFTWVKFRAACWDWGIKATRQRLKTGPQWGSRVMKECMSGEMTNDPEIIHERQNAGQQAQSQLQRRQTWTWLFGTHCHGHGQVFLCDKHGALKGPDNVFAVSLSYYNVGSPSRAHNFCQSLAISYCFIWEISVFVSFSTERWGSDQTLMKCASLLKTVDRNSLLNHTDTLFMKLIHFDCCSFYFSNSSIWNVL